MECVSVQFSALMVVTQTKCAVPPKNNGGKYSAISRRLLGYVYFFYKTKYLVYLYTYGRSDSISENL